MCSRAYAQKLYDTNARELACAWGMEIILYAAEGVAGPDAMPAVTAAITSPSGARARACAQRHTGFGSILEPVYTQGHMRCRF